MAFEFTFFTLADSGAFVTHVPKSLNEALALIRPFQWEVWFLFIFTIFVSGPAIYFVIVMPSWWQKANINKQTCRYRRADRKSLQRTRKPNQKKSLKFIRHSNEVLHVTYMKEMSYGIKDIPAMNRRYLRSKRDTRKKVLPIDLFNKCVWFAVTLFLRQCKQVLPLLCQSYYLRHYMFQLVSHHMTEIGHVSYQLCYG